MTMTTFAQLPLSVGVGATVTYTDDTSINPSESGVNSRKSLRSILRQYMCSINPGDAAEVQAIIMSHIGQRYPFAMRDWSSYQYTNETLAHTTTVASLQKTWAPSTGGRSVSQRILIPDQSEVATVVKVNGVVTAAWSFIDFGKIQFTSPILLGDTVTATGQYLTPVVLADMASATIHRKDLMQFSDIRLNEINESELTQLLA